MTALAPAADRGLRLVLPPQHGAWAFLLVPLLLGFALLGWSVPGLVLTVAWVAAYPASYFLGRAVVVRWRRGRWSRIATRERDRARPWIVIAAAASLALLPGRPWLLAAGAGLALAWGASLWLSRTGHERGLGNDLVLVGQASLAVPLLAAMTTPGWPASVAWQAAGVCLVFFAGSVLHVKSLIREAGNRRWAVASRAYHLTALASLAWSPWLVLPFAAAALRSFVVPPGARPAVIGGVETVVAVLVVVGGALALR